MLDALFLTLMPGTCVTLACMTNMAPSTLRRLAFLAFFVCAARCVYAALTIIASPVLMTDADAVSHVSLPQALWLQLQNVEHHVFRLKKPAFVDTVIMNSSSFFGQMSGGSSNRSNRSDENDVDDARHLVLQLPLLHLLPGFWAFNALVLMSVHVAYKVAMRPERSGVVMTVAMAVAYWVAYVTVSSLAQEPVWQSAKKIAVTLLTCSNSDGFSGYESSSVNNVIAAFAPVYRVLLGQVGGGSNSLCLNRDRLLTWLNLVHDALPLASAGVVVMMSSAKAVWNAL